MTFPKDSSNCADPDEIFFSVAFHLILNFYSKVSVYKSLMHHMDLAKVLKTVRYTFLSFA